MVELSTFLGRDVPTAREILEVIRPQLHVALCCGPALQVGIPRDGDNVPLDDADLSAIEAVFDGLVQDALGSVKSWASDVSKVYDGSKVLEFVDAVISECFYGPISEPIAVALRAVPEADACVRRLHGQLVPFGLGGDAVLLP